MADDQETFDDELLSAYLDDELSLEVRARVEARLTTDAAARKLLDELRSVSDAVKSMPPEPLGADVRATVLRRAERAMLVSSADEPAATIGGPNLRPNVASRITIGRTPRGWLWAGLAVAAALVLMFVASEPGQEDNLPREVAARSDERPAMARPAGGLEIRAAGEPRASTLSAGGVAEGTDYGGFDVDSRAVDALTADETVAGDRVAPPVPAARRMLDRENRGGGAVAGAIAESTSSDRSGDKYQWGDSELLVVNLRCPSKAIEQKALDGCLYKCNITVEEPEAALEESLARKVRPADDAAKGVRFQSESEIAAVGARAEGQPAEVVMVEATPAQIVRCLDEIEADPENFRGIVVEESSEAVDGVTTYDQAARKSLAGVEWQQYNRGHVPQQQKLERGPNNSFYFQTNGGQIVLAPTGGNEPMPAQLEQLAERSSSGAETGRALRLRSLGEVQQLRQFAELSDRADQGAAFDQPADGTDLGLAQRGAVMLPKAKANMLQVLFILHADDAAASPAASAPVPGLQKQD